MVASSSWLLASRWFFLAYGWLSAISFQLSVTNLKTLYCLIFLFIRGGFHDRAGAADHVVQRRSGCDHRVDRVFLLDVEIDQHGAVVFLGGLHCGDDFRALTDRHAADTIGFA